MSQGYNIQSLIECNRASSEEALSGNEEETSSWRNNLSNVYHLNAGDKVSVYSSFVGERGAGSADTIEIKGKSLGKLKSFTYIKDTTAETIRQQNIDNGTSIPENGYLTNGIEGAFSTNQISEYHEEVTEEIELRDDEVNIVVDYNKTADGNGYFQVPRNYVQRRLSQPRKTGADFLTSFAATGDSAFGGGAGDPVNYIWNVIDDNETGRPSYEANVIPAQYLRSDYRDDENHLKMKHDNKKFTIFIRKNIKYKQTEQPPITLDVDGLSRYLSVAPEAFDYIWYREKKTLKVQNGFISAQYVANDLSRQLQAVTKQYNISDLNYYSAPYTDKYKLTNRSAILETETYKTFFTNNFNYNKILYDDAIAINAPLAPITGRDLLYPINTRWYENYNTIGIKRPELWNAGNKLAINGVYEIADDGTISWPSLTPYPAVNPQQTTDKLRGTTLAKDHLYIDIDNNPVDIEPMEINIPYTPENLLLLKNFINAQELYPEIFDEWVKNESANTVPYYTPDNNIQNTRWFHMNNKNSQVWSNKNGTDARVVYNDDETKWTTDNRLRDFSGGLTEKQVFEEYKLNFERIYLGWGHWKPNFGNSTASQLQSLILLIHYNSKYRDTFFDNPDKVASNPDDSDLKLTYGCFTRTENNLIGVFIQNRSNKLHVPAIFINSNTETTARIEYGRKFGFDEHWNAFGTIAFGLDSGYGVGVNYYQGDHTEEGTTGILSLENRPSDYMIKRYIGAVEPTISFDGDHFSFSKLHTDMKIGNKLTNGANVAGQAFAAGGIPDANYAQQLQSQVDSPNDICYRINPQEDFIEFCIERCPYNYPEIKYTANGSVSANPVDGQLNSGDESWWRYKLNENLEPWIVYDSPTGIGISDMGFDNDLWDKSLWGTLGFSYEQFHSVNNNRLQRINTSNINSLNYLTTNSLVASKDTSSWIVNDNSVPLISERLPFNALNYLYTHTGSVVDGSNSPKVEDIKPEIIQKTSSISIVADNFPINMRSGYYTIRSDIVPDSFFVGGKFDNTNMPIVGIVNKQSPESNFFFTTEADIQFVITRPTILSSINVSIHDPDGTYANTSEDSSVIFKVERYIDASFDIVDQILNEGKK